MSDFWIYALIFIILIALFGWGKARQKRKNNLNNKWGLGTICQTDRGETVRSKSEKAIADCLNEMGIAYQYEKHFYFWKTTLKPDFYLPEYKVVIEFWGIMNSESYRDKMVFKKGLYDKHWLRCIDIFAEMIRDPKTKQIDMGKTRSYLRKVLQNINYR